MTVHGIRTFGQWQERLETLVCGDSEDKTIEFVNYKYGFFSIVAFIVPVFRWLVVRRFRDELIRLCTEMPRTRIDLVGHSFGTHIIGWSIAGLRSENEMQIHTVILSGSVLKAGFPWRDLIGPRVGRLINDCGTKDAILLLSQFCVLFTGMAGRTGFSGSTGANFRNRYSVFGHSGYFENKRGQPHNTYMERNWVPLLLDEARIVEFDARKPSALDGLTLMLANNAEPIKLLVYIAPLLAINWWIFQLYVTAVNERNQTFIGQSRFLADISRQNAEKDPVTAALIAMEALPSKTENATRPLVLEAQRRLYDAIELQKEETVLRGTAPVTSIALGKSRKLLAVFSDRSIRVWDLTQGPKLVIGTGADQANFVSSTFDHSKIAAISTDHVGRVWETENGSKLAEVSNLADQSELALSPDGMKLAAIRRPNSGEIWNLSGDRRTVVLEGGTTSIHKLAFNFDGSLVTGIDRDAHAAVWDTKTGAKVSTAESEEVFESRFLGLSNRVLIKAREHFTIWIPQSSVPQAKLADRFSKLNAVSDDGSRIVLSIASGFSVSHNQGEYDLVDGNDARELSTLYSFEEYPSTFTSILDDIQFDVRRGKIWASEDGKTTVSFDWNGRRLTSFPGRRPRLGNGGERLVSIATDNQVEVRKSEDAELLFTIDTGDQNVTSAEIDQELDRVLTGGSDGTVRIWNRTNLLDHSKLDVNEANIDGDVMDDIPTQLTGMQFSPDTRNLVTAAPPHNERLPVYKRMGTVRVWDSDTGKLVAGFSRSPGPDDTAVTPTFSKDGRSIKIESKDRSPIYWRWQEHRFENLGTDDQEPKEAQTQVDEFPESISPNLEVGVDSDGLTAIDKAGQKFYLGTWNADPGINMAVSSPDKRLLAVNDKSGEVRIQRVFEDLETLLSFVKSKVPRCLTITQRTKYFLKEAPPRWCITGPGRENLPAGRWIGVWPFDSAEARQWLVEVDLGTAKSASPPDFALRANTRN